jgi:hypothetical protein
VVAHHERAPSRFVCVLWLLTSAAANSSGSQCSMPPLFSWRRHAFLSRFQLLLFLTFLQAAAAERIRQSRDRPATAYHFHKHDILQAALCGDIQLLGDFLILDPTSVHTRGAGCGRITHVFGNASMNSDLFCMFLISVSYEVLSVLLPHSCYLLCMVTSKFANCSSRTKLTQMRRTSSRTPASHAHLKTNAAFWFDRCNPLLLSSQWTPLHESSYHGHTEICKLLMECKADVNARTRCQKPRLVSSPSPSPSAMQQQQNCTRIRNRRKQGRRHRSFAQQRGAAVSAAEQSPPPHNDELSNKFIPSLRHADGLPKADGRATESCYPDPGELFLQLRALFQALAPVLHTPPRGEGARARGGPSGARMERHQRDTHGSRGCAMFYC